MSILLIMVPACIVLQVEEIVTRYLQRAKLPRPNVHRVRRYRIG